MNTNANGGISMDNTPTGRQAQVEYVLERLGSLLDEARRWTNEADAHMLDVTLNDRGFQRVPYWQRAGRPRDAVRPFRYPPLDPTTLDGGVCEDQAC